MLKRFNQWQRFWGLFVVVFLASTLALIATLWPQRDPGIVADLRSTECGIWREIPEGVFPDDLPASKEPCYSIRSFAYQRHITLRSEGEYDRYLALAGEVAPPFEATG